MIQALQSEIDAEVDPRDLIHLSHDDRIYVAKCTAEAISRKRSERAARLAALESGGAVAHIWRAVASNI